MALSYVSSNYATATTIAMPTHAAGDLLIMTAFRGGATDITTPAGWTTLFVNQAFITSSRMTVAYKFAASGSETSGTWTNADHLVVAVYRGGGIRLGTVYGTANGSSTLVTVPQVIMTYPASSWVMTVGIHYNGGSTGNTVTGMTNRLSAADMWIKDTNGKVGRWTAQTFTAGSPAASWACVTVPLIETTPVSLFLGQN